MKPNMDTFLCQPHLSCAQDTVVDIRGIHELYETQWLGLKAFMGFMRSLMGA